MNSLPKPFYERDGITIYNGDCRGILPLLEPVDLVLTDPPYAEKTHLGARTEGGKVLVNFPSCDAAYLRDILSLCPPLRWCIVFVDWRFALPLEEVPPNGLEFVRLGIWSKLNPIPQLTGDRPAMGWEAIAILHPPGKKRWNGGGAPALWHHGTSRWGYFGPSHHPTEKPLGLMTTLVKQFSDANETILDPFMGSGTTLRAAKDLGRRAIGIEIEERYCAIAVERLRQEVLL